MKKVMFFAFLLCPAILCAEAEQPQEKSLRNMCNTTATPVRPVQNVKHYEKRLKEALEYAEQTGDTSVLADVIRASHENHSTFDPASFCVGGVLGAGVVALIAFAVLQR